MEIISQSRIGVEHNIFSLQIIPDTFSHEYKNM